MSLRAPEAASDCISRANRPGVRRLIPATRLSRVPPGTLLRRMFSWLTTRTQAWKRTTGQSVSVTHSGPSWALSKNDATEKERERAPDLDPRVDGAKFAGGLPGKRALSETSERGSR